MVALDLLVVGRPVARVAEIDPPSRVHPQVVGAVEPLPFVAVRENGQPALLVNRGHLSVGHLAHQQRAVEVDSQPVGLAGALAEHRDAGLGGPAMDPLVDDVAEVEVAVGVGRRTLEEPEPGRHPLDLRPERDQVAVLGCQEWDHGQHHQHRRAEESSRHARVRIRD